MLLARPYEDNGLGLRLGANRGKTVKSGNEDQDHRNDEREQTQKFGSREADEEAALLAVGRSRIAKRALKERTKHITHTASGNAGTNCCETGTDQFCCFCVHDNNSCMKLKNSG
jgi:hypothetical protein